MTARADLTPYQRSISSDAAERHADDFYATHPGAAHALVEAMGWRGQRFWEPACGDGSLARGLIDAGMVEAAASDLHDRGYGEPGRDFMRTIWNGRMPPPIVVTNPPYKLWVDFAERALADPHPAVALYGPGRLLSGGIQREAARRTTLFRERPPTWVMTFDRRIPVARGGDWSLAASPMNTDAWFVWVAGSPPDTPTRWRMISPHVPAGAWQPVISGRKPW